MKPDWEKMFWRYVVVVGEREGTDFLNDWDWSRKEWAAIVDLFARHRDKPSGLVVDERRAAYVAENDLIEDCSVPGARFCKRVGGGNTCLGHGSDDCPDDGALQEHIKRYPDFV